MLGVKKPLHLLKMGGVAMLATFGLQFPVSASEMSRDVPLEIEKVAYEAPWKRYPKWAKKRSTDWKDYSNLRYQVASPVSFLQKVDKTVEADPEVILNDPERSIAGNPKRGKELVADRSRGGSCFACHILPGSDLPGNVGINISNIGIWGRTDEYLFNYIYDPRIYNPTSVMPPWGAHGIFTKAEIRDIVAYLKILSKPVKFKDGDLNNPDRRPVPVEDRDNLDEFTNPAVLVIETAEELYAKKGATGKACVDCHAKPETEFAIWSTNMPKVSTRLNKVLGVEEFVTRHARATTGEDYLMQSDENTALSVYLRYLANGHPIAIDKRDHNTQLAIKRGEDLMHLPVGQLNFACVDCHEISKNKWIRGQYLGGVVGMMDHFPTYRTSRAEIWDIRKRLQWCNLSVRANELPPDAPEYGDIEIYLMSKNNGRTLSIPGIRH